MVNLCAMIHVMCNIVFTATAVASKTLTFLKATYFQYQVMEKLFNQVLTWTQPYRHTCETKLNIRL